MYNFFIEKFESYRKKCDKYFSDSSCYNFLNKYCFDEESKKYLDALVRHTDGGKRIRAFLVYLGYSIFSGFDSADKIFLPSLSYELFQTGILAHDDIIDKSDYRRFKPSMHKDLGGGHEGVSKSICVGDLGIVSAVDILLNSDFPADVVLKAVAHQNNVFASTIAGELKDIELSGNDFAQEKEVLEMYRLKTAQYTVSGPLVLGAVFAGADDEDIRKLSTFGDYVGISFQIKDDILGIFGDEDKLGKSVTSDMCEGKQTVITSYFKNNADKEKIKHFLSFYGNANSGICELEEVRKLLIESGSFDYAEKMCVEYTEKAKKIIDTLNVDETSKELLLGLLTYMTDRKY